MAMWDLFSTTLKCSLNISKLSSPCQKNKTKKVKKGVGWCGGVKISSSGGKMGPRRGVGGLASMAWFRMGTF